MLEISKEDVSSEKSNNYILNIEKNQKNINHLSNLIFDIISVFICNFDLTFLVFIIILFVIYCSLVYNIIGDI